MKRILPFILVAALLCGCGAKAEPAPAEAVESIVSENAPYRSQYNDAITIHLSDEGVTWDTPAGLNKNSVRLGWDIIYYEDRLTYDSGNPYGEGEAHQRHSQEEAAAHTVIDIVKPGAYRITGKLSQGQIRVDLGEYARIDPDAVVELILDNAEITCTVAPAILFLNVYECDLEGNENNATALVDTTKAGANIFLEAGSKNIVRGSHVAEIYKDKAGEKRLWKQDGAVYSYMSMTVAGQGDWDIYADNEGLDSEKHLTINGGNTTIRSDNDGINTNEDGVSVTTINGGNLHIIAGLGKEGDGIDSNGYLVINGGTVVSAANPAADAGLDSDLGSYINGGTVIALGSTMDWAESDSVQVTMNLQFAQYQTGDSAIVVTREDGTPIFAYDPSEDDILGENIRRYMGAIISCPNFRQGESYHVYSSGTITGSENAGIYDPSTVTAYTPGTQLGYGSNSISMGFPGMGGFGGKMPEGFEGQMPGNFGGQFPEGFDGQMPEGFEGQMPGNFGGQFPEGFDGQMPEGFEGQMPGNFGGQFPEGFDGQMPEGFEGQRPQGGEKGNRPENFDPSSFSENSDNNTASSEATILFYMEDMVNSFSGITPASN